MVLLAGCVLGVKPAGKETGFMIDSGRFAGMDGCAIVFDARMGKIAGVYGEKRCKERVTACSTFKVPLALMAFDSGVLSDESTVLKWDGVQWPFDSWNQDQTAASWLRNSVVWYSQRLTPMLGLEKIKAYLKAFDYGNQDFSSGLTSAWLTITKSDTNPDKGSLKISAYEELEFFRRFWRGALPVSGAAVEKTKKMIYLETSPGGYALHGKTGSGYLDGLTGDFGWFAGHVEGKGREYFVVTAVTRNGNAADARIPGLVAKELAKNILKDNSVW